MTLEEALSAAYRKTKWWQFKKKRLLLLGILARYYGITGRPEKENEILDKALTPKLLHATLKYMKKYLVTYQAQNKEKPSTICYGDTEITTSKPFRSYEDFKETRKIISKRIVEKGDWNVVILNVINFPIK